MRRILKIAQMHRILAMFLAAFMVVSMLPVRAFAAAPGAVTTDIGATTFVVGETTEFTISTAANDDAGKMVIGTAEFSDPDAIETLEYYEVQDGNWYPLLGDFGPASGFPMSDATSTFRVAFNEAGTYSVDIYIKSVEDGSVVCSTTAAATVLPHGTISTDAGDKTFVVGEATEFSFTTEANADAGKMVIGTAEFGDPTAITDLEYYEVQNGQWYPLTGDFGPASGFPMSDATSTFRVTFTQAGTYSLTAYMKQVGTGEILCQTMAVVTVKERATISYGTDRIEIKYSDVNATNATLVDSVANPEYTYQSGNEAIVKVDEAGLLTPVGVGETTVTVTRKENADYVAASASYTVTVVKGDQSGLVWDMTVPGSIAWDQNYSNTVSGGNGDGEVTYTSDNTEVAEVNAQTGELTMKKPGQVTITATKSGGDLYEDETAEYTLTVVKAQQAVLAFDETNPNAIYYGDTYTNKATGGSSGSKIQYKSSDESVATVDENGTITAQSSGEVTITATRAGDDYYEDAQAVEYKIWVYRADQVTGIVFSKGTGNQMIKVGWTQYVNEATGGDTGPITYSSSDDTVATVDPATGLITPVKAGNVTITATAPQTDQYLAQSVSYELEIGTGEQVVQFAVDPTEIPAITYGDPAYGNSFTNAATASTKVTYSVNPEGSGIVEVDPETGVVTILKSGTVTITASAESTEQYDAASASYDLTINKAAQVVSFAQGTAIEVTFNDNDNKFVNPATSNAVEAGEADITIEYAVVSGTEFIVENSFDPATGAFEIKGAGTIVVKVSFSTNDRYAANDSDADYYTLTVKKDDQTIAFDQTAYEMINGDNSFVAPTAAETSEHFGTGAIVYSIEKNEDGVVSAVDPVTGALTFTNKTGSVTIHALKVEDNDYNETGASYTLTVADAAIGNNVFHTLVGDKINVNSDWFTGNVSIAANEGYAISYAKDVENAVWGAVLTDAVTADGDSNTVSFHMRETATGKIYEEQTVTIKKDATDPTAEIKQEKLNGWDKLLSIITLNLWGEDDILFTIEDGDATSGVVSVEYYVAEGTTEVMSEAELDAVTGWQTYTGTIPVSKDKIFVVYAKVTDQAGQHIYATTNGIVFDRTEPVITHDIITTNYSDFYNTDVEVKVQVTDAQPTSGISSVTYEVWNNANPEGEKLTQSGTLFRFDVEDPAYSDLVESWDSAVGGNIIVDADLNNSDFVMVKITVTDNAGNTTTKEVPLKICTNEPTLNVEYVGVSDPGTSPIPDPDPVVTDGGIAYYDTARTAVITITGRTSVFHASQRPVVTVTATKGNSMTEETYAVSDWSTTENNGDPDAATHTCTITFNGSANYDFTVDYTDIFGNNLNYDETNLFAVDTDMPTATITIDTDNTWTMLTETLTFGLWSNTAVTVEATADDATSPVKLVEYFIDSAPGDVALSTSDMEKKTWTPYTGKVTIDTEGLFVFYLRVTDYVGHVEYFCSDGFIVDMAQSNLVITPADPNANGFYKDNFEVQFNVDDRAPYSGIKTVEYWVENNGVKTQGETLYSYEYERDAGDDSNGGHLVIKEWNENDGLIETFNQTGYVPTQAHLKASFSKKITVDAKKNNSDFVSIFLKVTDNAGNEATTSIENLKVDATAPKINVSFDTDRANVVGERGYLSTNRTATIRITERTSSFDRDKATAGIVFSGATDAGTDIPLDREAMIEWAESVETPGDPDAAVHTAYVYFTTDANYDFTVSYTDQAGNTCAYEDVTFAEAVTPRYFTVDKEDPAGSITVVDKSRQGLIGVLTFANFWKETVTVTAQADDVISPVTIEYYKTDSTVAMDWKALDALGGSDWKQFTPFDVSADERFTVYLKVTDSAGNYIYVSTDGHIVDMTEANIVLTPEPTDLYHDSVPLYNGDVVVRIDVREMLSETYSGIKQVDYRVKSGGEITQEGVLFLFGSTSYAHEDLVASFSDSVTIQSELNNSCDVVLSVGVTDNAGNHIEQSVAMDIDITAPVIDVTYSNNDPYKTVDGKGYFPAERTATVVITERTEHFDAIRATEGIQITAVDANGNVVMEDCSALISAWKTEGFSNGATHTATIDYSADANYTFAIDYTDLAGNSNDGVNTGDSAAPYVFAVDKTAPTGTVTAGNLGIWDRLIEMLTFGLWSRDTVDVTGTAADVTTPIESVSYYKTSDTTAKTAAELDAITDWTAFEGITVPADEQFVVYVRIVDSAGNVTYISTNGVIVDETIPAVESVKPEITITPEPAHGVYGSDVTVAVAVEDPQTGDTNAYAGLREVRYEVYNQDVKTQDGVLYAFDYSDPTHSQLLQTWSKGDAIVVDSELNNSNEVKVVVYAVDNAGNENMAECLIQIDITAPAISVSYDNNNGDTGFAESVYFKENRTAQIVVTERNFDPEMVQLTVSNSDGYLPEITGWTTVPGAGNGDGTTHTAYVVFDRDGDYTFEISCTDTAENANTEVDYAGSLAPTAFTVDKTLPVVNVAYDNNDAANGSYYKAARVATITVTEHNFETGRIVIRLQATDDGAPAVLPTVSGWNSNGDVHTATITYDADARYVFDFAYSDKAGNETADLEEQVFYVDQTNPVLTIEKIVDQSANSDEGDIGFVMTATDTNFDVFTPVLTAVVRNGDTFETKQLEIGEYTDIHNGKVFTVTNLEADGIYGITCTLVDKAGNAASEVTLEKADGSKYVQQRANGDVLAAFSVNRDGSSFGIDKNTLALVEQYYVQNVENNVVVVEINTDPLQENAVTLNGKELVAGTDYTVAEEGGNGAWMKYTYSVNKDLFAEEGEYKIVVSSKDKAGNDAFSDIKDAAVSFVVDRTAPVVTISGIATDGRYQTENQLVTLIPTDDGGALKTLVVNMVAEDGSTIREVINLSGEELAAELEANGGKITFEVAEGLYQNVQIVCTDHAIGDSGDTNTFDETARNVSVSSSVFMIFWANRALRWGTIGGVGAAAAGLGVFLGIKKKRKIV